LRKHVYDILVPVTYLHGDLKKQAAHRPTPSRWQAGDSPPHDSGYGPTPLGGGAQRSPATSRRQDDYETHPAK